MSSDLDSWVGLDILNSLAIALNSDSSRKLSSSDVYMKITYQSRPCRNRMKQDSQAKLINALSSLEFIHRRVKATTVGEEDGTGFWDASLG